MYVLKSFGKRFVADNVEPFAEGDLVLLGSDLPHFWKNDELFHSGEDDFRVNAIVIQFSKDFFEHEIGNYPEFYPIKKLLKRAQRGVRFEPAFSRKAEKDIKHLLKMKGLKQMLYFLELLDKMARTDHYRLLASDLYQVEEHEILNGRLDKIMHFINHNYHRKILQEEIAEKVGMNTAAFCRYFKAKTGKTFIRFVNEMRVAFACKLLVEGRMSVSQICFECGFNNLANFNRAFKSISGYTPTAYQEQFIKVKER
ncbi:MAG: AraC family transcriptional regulator [Prolixibacteraceae bacterium]|nr:AraC family transcriptional regulator [Prolixibacteraceae bacterium]